MPSLLQEGARCSGSSSPLASPLAPHTPLTPCTPSSGKHTPGKAVFDDVYNQPTPKGYVETFVNLDYWIADHTSAVIRRAVASLTAETGETVNMLELCCGYGLSNVQVATTLNSEMIFRHILASRSIEEDAAFIQRHLRSPRAPVRTIGVDVAHHALAYGRTVGLFGDTLNVNLEEDLMNAPQRKLVSSAKLIVATGAMSYITSATLSQLLDCFPKDGLPVILLFPLVQTPMEKIAELCESYGMTIYYDQGKHWLPQRVWKDAEEESALFAALETLGIKIPKVETALTHLHAVPFVALPQSISVDTAVSWCGE